MSTYSLLYLGRLFQYLNFIWVFIFLMTLYFYTLHFKRNICTFFFKHTRKWSLLPLWKEQQNLRTGVIVALVCTNLSANCIEIEEENNDKDESITNYSDMGEDSKLNDKEEIRTV